MGDIIALIKYWRDGEPMEQGRTKGVDGRELFRWYVYIDDGKRVISWAATASDARTKAIARGGRTVHRVDPAPPEE